MIIEFRNVTISRGGVSALEDVSWTFDSEKTPSVAVLGANGAGKSTLLEAVLGLRPLTSGQILIDEMPVGKGHLTQLRRRVGLVFQNSDDQLFSQTVREDVSFGPTHMELDAEEVKRRVDEALEKMGIVALAERSVSTLSGGEKRRAALAGVLAMHPEAVLLDEPTSMLDPRCCRELAEYLNTLEMMKLVATHDLLFATRVCPFCLILKDGKIHASGPTGDLLKDETLLMECGLA